MLIRQNRTHIFGIITSVDLLNFIVKHNKSNEKSKNKSTPDNDLNDPEETI